MKDFVKRMIEEHEVLSGNINRLDQYVYGKGVEIDDKVEFANKAIQLAAMKKYEESLRARLENQGVFCVDGRYVADVALLDEKVPVDSTKKSDE